MWLPSMWLPSSPGAQHPGQDSPMTYRNPDIGSSPKLVFEGSARRVVSRSGR
jgi:hypothetical protein